MKRTILLTFDIEEFDLPLEYNCSISDEEQIRISMEGTSRMNALLDEYSVNSTCFITSYFAEINPGLIRKLAEKHEIASHTYRHSRFEESDPEKSRKTLEAISGQSVEGFRMPKLQKIEYQHLIDAGFKYDSSLNPTFIPGRYNHFDKPRTLFKEKTTGFQILPVSVSPVIRFPLFWLSFKNIPLPLYFAFCKQCLSKDSYLHLYFHPWEFADLSRINIPGYIKRVSGNEYVKRFDRLLHFLSSQGEYSTISNFLSSS